MTITIVDRILFYLICFAIANTARELEVPFDIFVGASFLLYLLAYLLVGFYDYMVGND